MSTPLHHTWQDATPSDPGLDAADYRVLITAPRVSVELLAAVLHRLSTDSTDVTAARTLASHPCTALELRVRLTGPQEQAETAVRASLSDLTTDRGVDVLVQRADRAYALVAFDLDGTLVRGETVNRLAERVGRAREVATLTERAMRGELDFAAALRARVEVLRGLSVAALAEVATGLELMPGALVAVRTLQARGFRVGVVSGGFRQVAEPLAAALQLDFCVANELAAADGVLTGELAGELVDRQAKSAALRRLAVRFGIAVEDCVAVGDGANDIDMLRSAGLGIAFTERPRVVAAADVAISFSRLDLVLPVLGIPVPCTAI